MKKNLTALLTITAMLASGAAAFAEATPAPSPEATAEVTATAEPQGTEAPETATTAPEDAEATEAPVDDTAAPVVTTASYIAKTVTVTAIDDEKIETVLEGQDAENMDNIVNFTILDTTSVFGYAKGDKKTLKDVKKGDTITVFTNAYSPAPLILPPVYQADVIMVNDAKTSANFADVDTYLLEDETLVNAANTLALNIDKTTKIVDLDGKTVKEADLDKKDLLVIYSASTKSIPAQTTPIKVVVLGENEVALAQIEAAKNATPAPEATEIPAATLVPAETAAPAIEVTFTDATAVLYNGKTAAMTYVKDGSVMVPLRAIAEDFGYEVGWDDTTKTVTLNGGIFSMRIGENAYGVGKMMPQQLSSAPEIVNDRTYVPFTYFVEILELSSTVDADENGNAKTITLTLPEAE